MYKTLTLPLLVTLFMHGLIVAVILIGSPDLEPLHRKAVTKYIDARLVTLEKPKPAPKPSPKPKPKTDAAQQLAKQQEQQKQAQLEQQKQQQLAEQKAREDAIKKQQLAKKMEQEKIAEQQRRLKEQQQREFAELIAREAEQRQAESDAALSATYTDLISKVVTSHWSRPPSARNNMEVVLALQLIPTGEVVSVRVESSSGNAAFDRSAEKAVLKAGRFPELQNLPARIFEKDFRRLKLRFSPEDLRL